MRHDRLILLFALVAGPSLGAGCDGGDEDTDIDDTDTDGTDTDDTDTDGDTDTDDTDDTGPFLEIAFVGEGVISGSTYTGEESFVGTLGPSTPTPQVLCQWTWQANGTLPSSATLPCTNDQGDPCEFTLEVDLTSGMETGGDCSVLNVALPNEVLNIHYGFATDYAGQGPSLMYYVPADPNDPVNFPAEWYFSGAATYDSQTGDFSYDAPQLLYDYP